MDRPSVSPGYYIRWPDGRRSIARGDAAWFVLSMAPSFKELDGGVVNDSTDVAYVRPPRLRAMMLSREEQYSPHQRHRHRNHGGAPHAHEDVMHALVGPPNAKPFQVDMYTALMSRDEESIVSALNDALDRRQRRGYRVSDDGDGDPPSTVFGDVRVSHIVAHCVAVLERLLRQLMASKSPRDVARAFMDERTHAPIGAVIITATLLCYVLMASS